MQFSLTKDNGVWVFDDPNDGLAWEPFVDG
jgi:hypothetical protein